MAVGVADGVASAGRNRAWHIEGMDRLSDRRTVARALRYPDPAPPHPLRLTARGTAPLPDPAPAALLAEGRNAVIAVGANAGPARLREKLWGLAVDVPVVPAWLEHHAVVYSAHITRYGALPATLHPCPGARSRVAVLFLTPDELARLHASEALGENYRFARLHGLRLALAGDGTLEAAGAYLSLHGPLRRDGAPVALAAVNAAGVPYPALGQIEAQRLAMERLHATGPVRDFIRANAADPALRARRTRRLKAARAAAGA
jgi:hypothetical protein